MSITPLTQTQWTAALKAEGVHAEYMAGWTTAGRDSATGKPFGPVHGVMIHHTAGSNSLSVVRNGRSDLPGPLAHAHLAKDGVLTQLSVHRANHAGTVARNAYDAVVSESSVHPRPDAAEPIDGNDCFYGLEIENLGDGHDPYPAEQYDQAVRWAAAVCRAHGWHADSVIGHKEATHRKIDPSFNMDGFREGVADRLAHAASWSPGPTPPKETPVSVPKAFTDVVETDAIPSPRNAETHGTNPNWTLATYVRDIAEAQRRIESKLNILLTGKP
jgi:hypothetical protein